MNGLRAAPTPPDPMPYAVRAGTRLIHPDDGRHTGTVAAVEEEWAVVACEPCAGGCPDLRVPIRYITIDPAAADFQDHGVGI